MSSSVERVVPLAQAQRMLATGFEGKAGLFVETYRELVQRMSREDAKAILQRAMYRTGYQLGKEARALVDRDDTLGIAKSWEIIYGTDLKSERVLRLDEKGFTLCGHGCADLALFKRWGLSDEEVRFLADAFCIVDVGYAEGFSGKLYFQHSERAMVGDSECVWEFSMTPPEPAASRVIKPAGLDHP